MRHGRQARIGDFFMGVTVTALLACACSAPNGRSEGPREALADAAAVRSNPGKLAELPQPATPQGLEQPPRVVISELLTDPLLRDEGVGDYVELANLATLSLRLADLALWVPSGKRVALERPKQPWLLPGEVVVVRGAAMAGPEERTAIRAKGLRLPNSAGRVELWWRDRRIDVAQWQRKRPWPKSRPGVALERVTPQSDGTGPLAWRRATSAVDGLERGSPGRVEWPCSSVAGTALHSRCLAEPKRSPRSLCRR
jgi:hypothetical protein